MKISTFFLFLILSFGMLDIAHAQDGTTSSKSFQYFPEVLTVFPVFLGAGMGFNFKKNFEFSLVYGFTPVPYYQSIGSVASSTSGNSSYKDVIEAAFQNNSLWRFGFSYNFNDHSTGWQIGSAFSKLSASGNAGIDSVLSAATGQDYTQLVALLTAAGRSTVVAMGTTADILEIHLAYNWELMSKLNLSTSFGIAKVLNSSVSLSTGLPNFEASNAGKTILANSKSELESIIDQYGITPTLGLALSYSF